MVIKGNLNADRYIDVLKIMINYGDDFIFQEIIFQFKKQEKFKIS